MGRRRSIKVKAKKKVLVKLMPRKEYEQPYRIMDELVEEHHGNLSKSSAKIALAWRYGWKTDKDGRLKLGQARKASDLDRELHAYDFIILLNHEAWNAAEFSEKQMRALIDHELCHCEVMKDEKTGELKQDEQGRNVFRIRGHDVEEFTEIVGRHGIWKNDLEKFVRVAMEKKEAPLLRNSRKAQPEFITVAGQ